jgi:hypothetical protein
MSANLEKLISPPPRGSNGNYPTTRHYPPNYPQPFQKKLGFAIPAPILRFVDGNSSALGMEEDSCSHGEIW